MATKRVASLKTLRGTGQVLDASGESVDVTYEIELKQTMHVFEGGEAPGLYKTRASITNLGSGVIRDDVSSLKLDDGRELKIALFTSFMLPGRSAKIDFEGDEILEAFGISES